MILSANGGLGLGSATSTTIRLVEPGASIIHARMHAAIAGLDPGKFTEGHELPWKAPKQMIGRRLSQEEANGLLAKFEHR